MTAFFGVRGVGSLFYLAYAAGQAHFEDLRWLWATIAFTIALSVLVHGVLAKPAMSWLEVNRQREGRPERRNREPEGVAGRVGEPGAVGLGEPVDDVEAEAAARLLWPAAALERRVNRSNRCGTKSSGTPLPWSSTSSDTDRRPVRATVTTTGSAPYRSALLTRLVTIWRRWNGSTRATGYPRPAPPLAAPLVDARRGLRRRPRAGPRGRDGWRWCRSRSWPWPGCRRSGRRGGLAAAERLVDPHRAWSPRLSSSAGGRAAPRAARAPARGAADVVAHHPEHVGVELVDLLSSLVDPRHLPGQRALRR